MNSHAPTHPLRRILLAALGSISLTALATPTRSFAQPASFPSRPIRMVVPFAAGTTTDTVSRLLAEAMTVPLGQPVVVENRPGAGGTIGSEHVARAAADGYTMLMGTVGTHAIGKSLFRKLNYDPQRDFAPLGFVGFTPTLLVVGANSKIRTIKDLAAAGSSAPGVNFASAGNGSSGHLAGELLKTRLGASNFVHVPYKDGGAALTDVISGQVEFMFYHPAAVLPHLKSGKLRALGASGAQRSAAAPDVATIAEQIGQDYDLVAWFMLYAPVETPAAILTRLRAELAAALTRPDVAAKLAASGVERGNVSAGELDNFTQREIAKWAELVRLSGAQVD